MTHGLSLQASYTWSHATGSNTGPLYAGVFPLTSVPGDNNADKGNLPTDQRQRAIFNWTWQPTLMHGDSALARYVVNGWRFSGIATLASGQPVTPTVLLTGNQSSTFAMTYFNSLNGSGGWARVPFVPIGSLPHRCAEECGCAPDAHDTVHGAHARRSRHRSLQRVQHAAHHGTQHVRLSPRSPRFNQA